MKSSRNLFVFLAPLVLAACASQETHKSLEVTQTHAASTAQTFQGQRSPISIGKFENQTNYQRGVFSDNVDRLGSQAKTILITHLQQAGRFSVLDRANLSEAQQEAAFKGQAQNIKGANYVITGHVSEFGRKNQGDKQLFGILGRGKTQIAYAKVNLNVVDVNTSEVIFSAQGAGEYSLSDREVIGFGSTSSYDSTLNGKVLDLAMREAVDNLVAGIQSGRWHPNAN